MNSVPTRARLMRLFAAWSWILVRANEVAARDGRLAVELEEMLARVVGTPELARTGLVGGMGSGQQPRAGIGRRPRGY